MAVLFVLYIPCDEFEDTGVKDEVDQAENGRSKTEQEDKVGTAAVEPGATPSIPPSIKVDGVGAGEENPDKTKQNSLGAKKKDGTLRNVHSATGLDSSVDPDQQVEEDKPLLLSKKTDETSKSATLLSSVSQSQRNLAELKDDGINVSVGKFKVSKTPDGVGLDIIRRPSVVRNAETKDAEVHDITTEVITLREALFELLDSLDIETDVWEKNFAEDQWQIKFVIDTKQCDHVLNRLTSFGIGRIAGTSVSVFPASFHYFGKSDDEVAQEKSQEKEEKRQKSKFIESIKSRLTVAQVVGAVKSNATLTFDFLVLILLASMIAGLGLAESSSVVLVASMLISPLMGPIIGFTFGIVVKNPELWKLGVRNELIGLSICLTFGFLFGLFTGSINNTGMHWGGSSSWPTAEMQARGMLRSLWVGVLIALPSGAGVALSILGGNTGSLVGVAISASLLPPAVNAGMLWGLSLVSAISHPTLISPNNSSFYSGVPPSCQPLFNNEYKFQYSCEMQTEAAILASVSLLLTILNIICIFLMGTIVLKIKEIAPHRAMSPATAAFWKRDLAFARGAYRTIKGRACMDMAKMAKDVIADFKASNPNRLVENVIGEIQHDPALYQIPEELPEKAVPEFLRQLSHEGHIFGRQCENSMDTVRLGDRVYHTVANNSVARKVLQNTPSIPNGILDSGDRTKVVRFRVRTGSTPHTGSTPQSPLSPLPESVPEGELLVFDVRRPSDARRIGRKERLSARFSAGHHLTPTVGRFKVKHIPEADHQTSSQQTPRNVDLKDFTNDMSV